MCAYFFQYDTVFYIPLFYYSNKTYSKKQHSIISPNSHPLNTHCSSSLTIPPTPHHNLYPPSLHLQNSYLLYLILFEPAEIFQKSNITFRKYQIQELKRSQVLMNRIYLDQDRTIEAQMSSDASLQTDQINHRNKKINMRDLGFYFSLYCQEMKKELSKHLNSIVRDFYSRMQIFLDDQVFEREDSKNSKLVTVLKTWKPKLELFEEKYQELKSHLPHMDNKKKHKFEDFRKIRFVQILDKILSKTQSVAKNNQNSINDTSSKVKFEHYLNIAQSLYDQGRFQEAISKSKQILKSKTYPELNFVLGNCYKAIGYYKEAIHEYNFAIDSSPRGCYFNNRGNCYLCIQDILKAEEDYRKAIEYQPNNEVFLGNYGNVCLTLKKFDEAIDVYNKALVIGPQNDFFYNNRAFAQIKLRKFTEAIESYNQAICLSPMNHVYLKNRANLFMEKKMIPQAIEDISKAIEIEPNKHEYYFLKAKWQYLMGKPQDAMMSFRRAFELDPSKKTYRDYYLAIKSELGYK